MGAKQTYSILLTLLLVCLIVGSIPPAQQEPAFTILNPIKPPQKTIQEKNSMTWYGIGTDWKVYADDDGEPASIETVLTRWASELTYLRQYGLNTVRLACSMTNSGTTYHSKIVNSELSQVITLLANNGIKVIIDLHDWQDMVNHFGSTNWTSDWVAFANAFKTDTNILAYELFNEPFGPESAPYNNWAESITGSGAGTYDGSEEAAEALATCYDAIRATGDTHPIIYPDLWFWRGSNGYSDVNTPSEFTGDETIYRDVIITSHDYGSSAPALADPAAYVAERKARLQTWITAGETIWAGEFGTESNPAAEAEFCWRWINTCLELGIGFSFWMHGYASRAVAWSTFATALEASDFVLPSFPVYVSQLINCRR